MTPLTLSQQQLPNHRNGSGAGGGGGRQSDDEGEGGGEADVFLEDDTVTTGGIREHYELREGSQIVL